MEHIVDFYFVSETTSKDAHAQPVVVPSYILCVGKMRSVYQSEYFEAAQSGIRPTFTIETPAVNYHGEKLIKYDGNTYVIYRTYNVGTDKIELHCAERVGTNGT